MKYAKIGYKYLLEKSKGFTLLELIIASGIFAFVISGILILFINSSILDNANRNKSIAVSHAETTMEYIRSMHSQDHFDTILNSLCSLGNSTTWDLTSTLNLSGLSNETVTVTTSSDCTNSNLTLLDYTVNVAWLDRGQRSRSLVIETAISKRTP